jgi:hypothetical protein
MDKLAARQCRPREPGAVRKAIVHRFFSQFGRLAFA